MTDFELGFEHGRRVLDCRRLEEYDDKLVNSVEGYPPNPPPPGPEVFEWKRREWVAILPEVWGEDSW